MRFEFDYRIVRDLLEQGRIGFDPDQDALYDYEIETWTNYMPTERVVSQHLYCMRQLWLPLAFDDNNGGDKDRLLFLKKLSHPAVKPHLEKNPPKSMEEMISSVQEAIDNYDMMALGRGLGQEPS
jgi:hypothetical protein